jgi:hypothetical protein
VGGALQTLGPQLVLQAINPREYMARRAAALGIETNNLIYTEEQAAEQMAAAGPDAGDAEKLGPSCSPRSGSIGLLPTWPNTNAEAKIATAPATTPRQSSKRTTWQTIPTQQRSPGQSRDLGETTRSPPDAQGAQPAPQQTAEEQAQQANETPEEKAAREAADAGDPRGRRRTGSRRKARNSPKPVDLKGTVFEGLSPEMQGKVAPYAAAFAENGTLTDAEVTEAAKPPASPRPLSGSSWPGHRRRLAEAKPPSSRSLRRGCQLPRVPGLDGAGGQPHPPRPKPSTRPLASTRTGSPSRTSTPDYEMAAQLMKAPMERWKAAGGGLAGPRCHPTSPARLRAVAKGDVYESWAQLTKDQVQRR